MLCRQDAAGRRGGFKGESKEALALHLHTIRRMATATAVTHSWMKGSTSPWSPSPCSHHTTYEHAWMAVRRAGALTVEEQAVRLQPGSTGPVLRDLFCPPARQLQHLQHQHKMGYGQSSDLLVPEIPRAPRTRQHPADTEPDCSQTLVSSGARKLVPWSRTLGGTAGTCAR